MDFIAYCVLGMLVILCWFFSALGLRAACAFLNVEIDTTQASLLVLLQAFACKALSICGILMLRRQYEPFFPSFELQLLVGVPLFTFGLLLSAWMYRRFLLDVSFRKGLVLATLELAISSMLIALLFSPLYFFSVFTRR